MFSFGEERALGGDTPRRALRFNGSSATAADDKKCDDQDPDPTIVVVEYAAKTVVIHKISSLSDTV